MDERTGCVTGAVAVAPVELAEPRCSLVFPSFGTSLPSVYNNKR
jgi:hypothetical protein